MSLDQLKISIGILLNPQSDVTLRKQADSFLQHFRTSTDAALICMQALLNQCTDSEHQFLSATLVTICRKRAPPQQLAMLGIQLTDILNAHHHSFSATVNSNLASSLVLGFIRGDVSPDDILVSLFQCQWSHPLILLRLLHALAYETTNKQTSMHPERRSLIVSAMSVCSSDVASFFASAVRSISFGSSSFEQAVSAVEEWSSSFGVPPGLESHSDVLLILCGSVFQPQTSLTAASCLCSLFSSANSQSQSESNALLHTLLLQWSHSSQSSFTSSLSIHHWPLEGSDWGQEKVVLSSTCQVLSAATSSILRSKARHKDSLTSLFGQLLAMLGCCYDEVALIATNFFSDQYLPSLKSLLMSSPNERDTILASHSPLLQSLAESLIHRTRLKRSEALQSTADARDVGSDAKQMRRELTSTIKIISSLVGHSSMIIFVSSALERTFVEFRGSTAVESLLVERWTGLEACLYAANICVGCLLAGGGDEGEAMADSDEDESLLSNDLPTHQSQPSTSYLVDGALSNILSVAASSSNHINGHPKLTGTALTLIGALSRWSALIDRHKSDLLLKVQQTILVSIASSDPKLSRNGATSLQRLTSGSSLSHHITTHHAGWIDKIAHCYQERGGMVQKAGPREDASTEEILLMSLSRLACLCSNGEDPSRSLGLLSSLISHQIWIIHDVVNGSTDLLAFSKSIDVVSALINNCLGLGEASPALCQLSTATWTMLKDVIRQNKQVVALNHTSDSLGAFLSASIRAFIANRGPGREVYELVSEAQGFAASIEPHLFFSLPGLIDLLSVSLEGNSYVQGALQPGEDKKALDSLSHGFETILNSLISIGSREILSSQSAAGSSTDVGLIESYTRILSACIKSRVNMFNSSSESFELVIAATCALCGLGQSDIDGCHIVLGWYENLFKLSYLEDLSKDGLVASPHLHSLLESAGSGPRLLQGLYLASLSMPSVLILKISSTLHTICFTVGSDRFIAWTLAAFLLPSPLSLMPPWQGLKPETRTSLVHEMVGAVGDVNKFKRIVKLLTGGKKKGESVK